MKLHPGLISQRGQQGRGILSLGPQVRAQLQSCPSLGRHSEELELLERAQRRHQHEQRDGAALLGGKAGTAGIVQPGQKIQGDFIVAILPDKEAIQEL
ncbi:hypothetical protein DUI87_14001 [Hirundo rustica rustica]|uniref:Uncharacterized protein n=1 Tax=Hirundo rustica rustica TaxID=333673 RepID=A0A3M0K746_HIRRU|nr:hypothetical protein DUI87_14001 [Hirundo rustica rustica]